MKKYISFIIVAVLTLGLLGGCGTAKGSESGDSTTAGSDKLQIVTTIFPEYDWVMNVLGNQADNAEVTMLLDSGVDLHSYEPTPEDVLKITTCDLFVYVGGESDKWVDDALAEAVNEDMVVINLMDVLGDSVSEEEVVEGMEAEEEAEESEGEEAEEEVEYDEHVWLSLNNASAIVAKIAEALATLDEANADAYKANGASYTEQLNALSQEYQAAVDSASIQTILFGDRFPFRYMVDDYNLSYYAAFVGCSAETEASFETVTFLANKVDELSLPAVLIIDGSDGKIAETVVENTTAKNQKILTMNSMQSTTTQDVEDGMTYLSVMKDNLVILKEALGLESSETGSEPTASKGTESDTIDVDLTALSSTMVYSEVYNMMYEPDSYMGKTIKMTGLYNQYYDEEKDFTYHACIVQDATACCAQGIEFVPSESSKSTGESLKANDMITVVGVFDTYEENGSKYCTLRNATVETA